MKRLRRNVNTTGTRRGVLTFEWILMISLLVIGVIGGLSAVRNSLLTELNDLDECIQALNTSSTVTPLVGPNGEIVEGSGAWYGPAVVLGE